MHVIVIASYLIAAAAFLVGSVLLGVSWRGQRTGALLVVAALAMTAWGVFLAYAEWQRTVAISWVMLAEVLRYGAWLVFLSALFGASPMAGLLRGLRITAHVLWVALALYCVLPGTSLARSAALPFTISLPLVGMLVLALIGVVFLEQIYRNISPERRWAMKFLVIALGVMFAYDIFLYSYAVLYQRFNLSAWAARGFIVATLVPLLLVAAARNPVWSLEVAVSRRVVFYSTSLLVVAFYIIATAMGGYYVRLYGGDWGRVAEITLACFALLSVLLIASSGQARSRLRVFLHKNFFSFRYDYREEWLRLTTTLSASDTELPLRAVRALAQILDSPAGALLICDDEGQLVPEARWNMPVPADLKLSTELPALEFMRERQWIYNLDDAPPLGEAKLRAPAELQALPRVWLLVPLVQEQRLVGLVVLAQARAKRSFDWEDIDLVRAAGSQVSGTLAQAMNARSLAEARQFEGFNRLTAFLMHDLKNVAAQQSLLLQNAERHKRNPAFVDDMLTTVANAVGRISRLLEQLRGGVTPATLARVQLDVVIDKALAECQAQLPRPTYEPAQERLWVQADPEQFATVLGHVLRNAQDAAQAHGHVTLTLKRVAGDAAIEIEDDGAGMDEEFIRDRLFKPFFSTKESKGMGVGAYQAREYVRSLGGAVSVASVPGQGTVFTIRLPLADRDENSLRPGPLAATS
ncbi:PEP-CTERM system histidine kinase PrsK [Rhodanobacter sp. AS-Z3]|uniref:XrtA/PEP-CTERM system histidine kinase PrsK n=1 Tax=Rhodanobacter sp. AS-Z3 TaxID=3031330 RepID=UPI00247A4344|nr:XrtA/PEP-CTERM system histidine kinase PrsK [Rhodanobacter sp. AS-Z3]WEN15361.1 PEP-CTERM system histidine kinase PrsK [Rhodanobacter sp. AS-Z3]